MIDDDGIAKLLSDFDHTYMDRKRPKGPDYLIIDNFVDFFEIDKADLIDAKREAEGMSDFSCSSEIEDGVCDKLIWLKNLQN